jgi:hypothetical protein
MADTMAARKMASKAAEKFKQALQHLERTGELNALVALFSEDAVLSRQGKIANGGGLETTREFWGHYLASFQEIHSTFTSTLIAEELVVLEWFSEGALVGGSPVNYGGVSLLLLDPSGRVKAFRTYFDSAALEQFATDRRAS